MINRDMRTVSLVSYPTTTDSYGQIKLGTETLTSILMDVVDYTCRNTNDMRYVEVEKVGLTKATVTDANRIKIDNVYYDVLFVLPSKRYNQVLMKRHG